MLGGLAFIHPGAISLLIVPAYLFDRLFICMFILQGMEYVDYRTLVGQCKTTMYKSSNWTYVLAVLFDLSYNCSFAHLFLISIVFRLRVLPCRKSHGHLVFLTYRTWKTEDVGAGIYKITPGPKTATAGLSWYESKTEVRSPQDAVQAATKTGTL
jgi:hypothetical protein